MYSSNKVINVVITFIKCHSSWLKERITKEYTKNTFFVIYVHDDSGTLPKTDNIRWLNNFFKL